MSRYRGMRYTQVCDKHTSFKTHRTENSLSYERKDPTAEGIGCTPISSVAPTLSVSFRTPTGLGVSRGQQQACSRARATEVSGIDAVNESPRIGITSLISSHGVIDQ